MIFMPATLFNHVLAHFFPPRRFLFLIYLSTTIRFHSYVCHYVRRAGTKEDSSIEYELELLSIIPVKDLEDMTPAELLAAACVMLREKSIMGGIIGIMRHSPTTSSFFSPQRSIDIPFAFNQPLLVWTGQANASEGANGCAGSSLILHTSLSQSE